MPDRLERAFIIILSVCDTLRGWPVHPVLVDHADRI